MPVVKSSPSITMDLVNKLAGIAGQDNVLTSVKDREEYAFDAFPLSKAKEIGYGDKLRLPDVIARPASASEVQQVVRLANQASVPIVPYGAGTGVMGAATPLHGGVVLDLKRLDRVTEICETGLTACVEAGTLLENVEDALATRGLMLGHDPWSRKIATIGGAVSTNGVGYLAAGYGTMGEQVLGLDVVLPNGDVLQSKSVSTSAGPMLWPLFIGAEGTLGVITAVTIRVFPAPQLRTLHGYGFASFRDGFNAIVAMRRKGVRLSMIDYSQEPLAEIKESMLYLAFEGFEVDVETQENGAREVCLAYGAIELSQVRATQFWDERHKAADAWLKRNAKGRRFARSQEPKVGVGWFDYLHFALPPSEVLGFKVRCESLVAEAGLFVTEFAIWGRPDLFSVVLGKEDDTEIDSAQELVGKLVIMAQDDGGSMEYCHGVGLKLERFIDRELGSGKQSFGAIKSALDPHGIMNPGKLGT